MATVTHAIRSETQHTNRRASVQRGFAELEESITTKRDASGPLKFGLLRDQRSERVLMQDRSNVVTADREIPS